MCVFYHDQRRSKPSAPKATAAAAAPSEPKRDGEGDDDVQWPKRARDDPPKSETETETGAASLPLDKRQRMNRNRLIALATQASKKAADVVQAAKVRRREDGSSPSGLLRHWMARSFSCCCCCCCCFLCVTAPAAHCCCFSFFSFSDACGRPRTASLACLLSCWSRPGALSCRQSSTSTTLLSWSASFTPSGAGRRPSTRPWRILFGPSTRQRSRTLKW